MRALLKKFSSFSSTHKMHTANPTGNLNILRDKNFGGASLGKEGVCIEGVSENKTKYLHVYTVKSLWRKLGIF